MSMNDLPAHSLLQQLHAPKISGEHLEVLGKRAAAIWAEGRVDSLNDAVVNTVKQAGLSPEQVKRVVEFANTAAYLSEFNKEGSPHRVVDFGSHGPANPGVVLQDLNDGGGGSVFDPGTGDYNAPPATTKQASAWDEVAFAQMFGPEPAAYPDHNPFEEVLTLRDKLASEYDRTTSMLSELEVAYHDIQNDLFNSVKQASLAGHSLSEIIQIWENVAPSAEHTKVAFASVLDALVDNGVFRNHEAIAESLQKYASVGVVNPAHPLVTGFSDFCNVITKLAEVREMQQEFGEGVARLTSFLKQEKTADSAQGLLPAAWNAYKNLADKAGRGLATTGKYLLGTESKVPQQLEKGVPWAAKNVVPALAGVEAYRTVSRSAPYNTVMGMVPGTPQFRQRGYELDAEAQGYNPYSYGGY
jgi:hypothetical protein